MAKQGDAATTRRSRRQAGIPPTPAVTKSKKQKKQRLVLEDEDDYLEHVGTFQTENTQPGEERTQPQDERTQPQEERTQPQDERTYMSEEEIMQPQAESVQPQEGSTQPSNGEAEDDETSTKKRTIGLTKMRGVAKQPEEKVDVEFNSLGEHVGKGSVTLSSFLGPLVREHVFVLLDDWRHLDEKTNYVLWEEIQGRFNLTEDWQKACVFKQMGCIWRASKSRLVTQVRSASRTAIPTLKPSNIQSMAEWMKWVKSKTTEEFKVHSDKYRELRKAQIPHTTSRKGMIRLAHEMKKKSTDPSKVTRSKIWVAGHTHSDGRPVRPEFAETIEQIKSIDTEMGSTCSNNFRDDAVSQVLGKDKNGRVRGMGRGVTATKLAFIQARDTHVMKLEETQVELLKKIEELQTEVRNIVKDKKCDDSVTETTSFRKVVTRCQLLDWCEVGDVVVAEGEFCSAEPMYKIGRVPLGPGAAAVVVNSVTKTDAYVWRPTTSIFSVGQALGNKIAWPADKIILDNEQAEVQTSASSESLGKILIIDWTCDDVIAEGGLLSTDPKQLVDNIPLGPNAAVVKVEKVIKKEAYLWRPSPDMSTIGDALHLSIAWPIQKIDMINKSPNRVSPLSSSPRSVTNSLDTSKSSPEKTCLLLDCNNSGKTVAEGRVISTNPEDRVHFVPLGENACKVFVLVAKIGDARVWRPNAEVEFISDAIGTTVAWPSDKVKFV